MSFTIWVAVLGRVLLILALTSSYLRWLPITTSVVCLAQVAISKQIHALEQYLDTTLLTRSNRTVFLTATGKEFRDAVRTALLELATKTEKLRRKLACIESVGFALGWRRTTEKMIDNGELIRPLEQSIKVDEALAVYQWQNSPLRARSRSLLQWLRRVCQD